MRFVGGGGGISSMSGFRTRAFESDIVRRRFEKSVTVMRKC